MNFLIQNFAIRIQTKGLTLTQEQITNYSLHFTYTFIQINAYHSHSSLKDNFNNTETKFLFKYTLSIRTVNEQNV